MAAEAGKKVSSIIHNETGPALTWTERLLSEEEDITPKETHKCKITGYK